MAKKNKNNEKLETATSVKKADFSTRSTKVTKFNTGIVRFSRLYSETNIWFKYFFVGFLGIVIALLTLLLVKNTGLYTGGVTAMFQGVARLAFVVMTKANIANADLYYNLMFWGFYLIVVNIPLFVWGYFKVGKHFSLLSAVYLIFCQGLGFGLSMIPELSNFYLFGVTATLDQNLLNNDVQVLLFAPNLFPTINATTGGFDWSNPTTAANSQQLIINSIEGQNITRILLLFVYAFVFAFATSTVYSLLYIIGGSSAGSDFISVYFSQEKNKSLGKIIITINGTCMLIGIILGSYVSGIIVNPEYYSGWQYFLSGNLVCSYTWVVLHGVLVDKLFPWQKLARVEIYTDKIQEIRAHLLDVNYTHPTTIIDATGGYSQQTKKILVSITMLVELPKLIAAVRIVDEKCLISTSYIADLDGNMMMQKQTG